MWFSRAKKERSLFKPKKPKRKRSSQRGQGIKVKNTELENSIFKSRMLIAILVSVICAGILFANLYYLQVVLYDVYSTRSNENRIRILPVIPQRGIIYDRNHVVLAENRPVFHLVLYPSKDIDTRDTIEQLDTLLSLNLTDKEVENLLYLSKTRQRFSGIEISDLLSEEQIASFSVNRHRFPNVQISANLNRFYPFADIMTHALGYVSRINQADVENLTAQGKIDNYEGSSAIGKLGIERFYEDILHGTTGSREVEVDSHGRVIRTLRFNPPKPGLDITLSIDIRLQYYAQELLHNMRGAIVAIEPSTGELLAFYSNPSYDPNLFVRGIRTGEYKRLLENPGKPLINRVTQGGYAPASTVKPLLAIMGLNEGLVTPTSSYFGAPAFMLPGSSHRFRDWRSWGHGWLDLYRAIEVSADTYFYDLAHRAGIDTIHEYLDRFGFGRRTGIDINEESLGINPSKQWKMNRFGQSWHLGDTVPIGIGQGYWTTTLLQLCKAHATLANYGRIVTPHLLRKVTDPSLDNAEVLDFEEVLIARQNGTIDNLRQALNVKTALEPASLTASLEDKPQGGELEEEEEQEEKTGDIFDEAAKLLHPELSDHAANDEALESASSQTQDDEHPLLNQVFEVKDPSYWDVARAGMYLVVNGPEGTGRRAFNGAKYKAAGKSGTAQLVSIKQGEKYNASALKVEHRDNALFVAFAPFKHPRILVVLILENEGGGSAKAAPIARKLIDKYLLELYPGGYMGENPGVTQKFGLGGTVVVQ